MWDHRNINSTAVSVYETSGGEVYVSRMNLGRMSAMFGGTVRDALQGGSVNLERGRHDNPSEIRTQDPRAVVDQLEGVCSPEAQAAAEAYRAALPELTERMLRCSSGKELTQKGFARDVELAAEVNVSDCVPALVDGAYVDQSNGIV